MTIWSVFCSSEILFDKSDPSDVVFEKLISIPAARFMRHYLRTDGMLVLKLVRLNMGVNTTTEIVENLFRHFKKLDTALTYSDSLDTLNSYKTLGNASIAPSAAPSVGVPSRPNSPLSGISNNFNNNNNNNAHGIPNMSSLDRRVVHANSFHSHQNGHANQHHQHQHPHHGSHSSNTIVWFHSGKSKKFLFNTLFMFYKNLVCKNIKPWNCSEIKNIVVILLVAISIFFEGFRKIMTFF